MKDQRFNSGLFLILFVLATTLINLGSASCSDHSRPSGENWANDWDDDVNYNCGKGYSISRIRSIHRDCIEDRIWAFSCESNSAAQHCSWSHTLNSYDGVLDYKCPHDGFISGIYSWHLNGREDRRFQFKCCHSHSWQRKNCRWSFLTDYDRPFTYYTPYGYYLAGAYSFHHNYYEDRRWQFYSCMKY